jgi:DNA-binding response OmpR family regulator
MKKNILIYDDDEEILVLCKAILSTFGFVVGTLSRCENILKDIRSLQPDLILMDLWIPEMGGEKAITILKENEETKNIPVLIFSANADIMTISKNVNADGYVEKPFAINTFIATIKRFTGENAFSGDALLK